MMDFGCAPSMKSMASMNSITVSQEQYPQNPRKMFMRKEAWAAGGDEISSNEGAGLEITAQRSRNPSFSASYHTIDTADTDIESTPETFTDQDAGKDLTETNVVIMTLRGAPGMNPTTSSLPSSIDQRKPISPLLSPI